MKMPKPTTTTVGELITYLRQWPDDLPVVLLDTTVVSHQGAKWQRFHYRSVGPGQNALAEIEPILAVGQTLEIKNIRQGGDE